MKKRRNILQSGKTRRVRNILARPNGQNKNYERGTAVLGAKMGIAMQTTNQTTKQTTFHPQADQTNDHTNTSRTQPADSITQKTKTRTNPTAHIPASPLPTQRERSHKTVLFLTQSAVIAALYIVFTMVSAAFGLSSGVIQVRISEAMCILPAFTPAAIPGLTIGCFIANLLSGGVILDAVFGGLATLLGAVGAYLLGRVLHKNNLVKGVVLSLPNLVANTLIVPWVLYLVYQAEGTVPYFMLTVGAGELIAGTILGAALFIPLARAWNKLPQKQQLK